MTNFRARFAQFSRQPKVEVGNFVSWDHLGKPCQGRVETVYTSGTITPPGSSRPLVASQAAPVLEVALYRQNGDVWEQTGERSTLPAVTCKLTADLRRPASYTGCTVIHKDNGPDEIVIYSDIGAGGFWDDTPGITGQTVRDQLAKIKPGKAIDLRINSPGGDAFEGMAIYNILAQHAKKTGTVITGYNDGLCASAATVIMMAAKKIVAGQQSLFMIHRAFSIAFGTGNDMRKSADMLDRIDGQTIDLYHDRVSATLSRDAVEKMVDDETYMTADEQVKNGFADEVFETSGKVAAYGPLRPWMHKLPENLRKQFSQSISRVPSISDRAEAA